MKRYVISSLMAVSYRPKSRQFELDQSRITEEAQFDCFADVRRYVLDRLRYPTEQSNKYECYGWVPARFYESIHDRWGELGWWRQASAQDEWLTMLVVDVDNRCGWQRWDWIVDEISAKKVAFFAYQTYSATDDRNKCRIIFDVTRKLTNAEAHRILSLLSQLWFAGDLDLSCYSVGDQFYGPPADPRRHTMSSSHDEPLDVDGWLAQCDQAQQQNPQWFQPLPKPKPARPLSPAQAGIVALLISLRTTLRDDRTIENPNFYRPEWRGEYAATSVNGSHWETMRSLLGRLWLKSGGSFTWGEMERALDAIDAEAGGYFRRTYNKSKADDLIEFTMRTPVGP
jgi:hypothetical protein